jgi:hypothetical protein
MVFETDPSSCPLAKIPKIDPAAVFSRNPMKI